MRIYVTCFMSAVDVPTCRRPVGRWTWILTARNGPRFDGFERCVLAGVGEQPRTLADDHEKDEKIALVDKIVVEQPPDQGAAAVHLQLTSRLGSQLADGRRDLTAEDSRLRPPRAGE